MIRLRISVFLPICSLALHALDSRGSITGQAADVRGAIVPRVKVGGIMLQIRPYVNSVTANIRVDGPPGGSELTLDGAPNTSTSGGTQKGAAVNVTTRGGGNQIRGSAGGVGPRGSSRTNSPTISACTVSGGRRRTGVSAARL
jgi:hypothetical protein